VEDDEEAAHGGSSYGHSTDEVCCTDKVG
jgi:hypothetical protein